MRRFLVTTLVVVVLFSGLGQGFAAATEPEDKRNALAIFDAAVAQFEASRVPLRKWQYHQTLTTHQFDNDGEVVAKGTWRSIVRPGE